MSGVHMLSVPARAWSTKMVEHLFEAAWDYNRPEEIYDAATLLRRGQITARVVHVPAVATPQSAGKRLGTYLSADDGRAGPQHAKRKWVMWNVLKALGEREPCYEFEYVDVYAPHLLIACECGYCPVRRMLRTLCFPEGTPIDPHRFIVYPYTTDYAVLFSRNPGNPPNWLPSTEEPDGYVEWLRQTNPGLYALVQYSRERQGVLRGRCNHREGGMRAADYLPKMGGRE